ncbi:hypothetical protein A2U01_0100038, partial [Trifolium medium]|nr:hypothetical protein [Trifolium medium]
HAKPLGIKLDGRIEDLELIHDVVESETHPIEDVLPEDSDLFNKFSTGGQAMSSLRLILNRSH